MRALHPLHRHSKASIPLQFMHAALELDCLIGQVCRVFDVSERELRVIAHLTFRGPMSATELAATMHVTRGGMSAILQRLSANGWVDVQPDPEDGRRSRVLSSDRSLDLFEQWLESLRVTLGDLGHLPLGFVDGLVLGGRAFRQHRELLASMGPAELRSLVDR